MCLVFSYCRPLKPSVEVNHLHNLRADKCTIHLDTISELQTALLVYNGEAGKMDTVSLNQAKQCLGRDESAFMSCDELQQKLGNLNPSLKQRVINTPIN